MPNKKQRLRNRQTAKQLRRRVQHAQLCPECGEPSEGGHWITTRETTLEDLVHAQHSGVPLKPADFGFWTCAKFYGPDGRRLSEFVNPRFNADSQLAASLALLAGAGLFKSDGVPRTIQTSNPGGSDQMRQLYEESAEQQILKEQVLPSEIWSSDEKPTTAAPDRAELVQKLREDVYRYLTGDAPAADGAAKTLG